MSRRADPPAMVKIAALLPRRPHLTMVRILLQNALSPWAQQVMPEFAAAALALPQLPPSTTFTLRSLKVDESGITLQPMLGTIGTGLSTFKPAPLPAS